MNISKFFSFKKDSNIIKNRESCNKNHLDYTKKISSSIHDICEPLFANFGITMFTYCRIFNGGQRSYICSNQQWVEHYITHEFQDEIEHLAHYVPPDGIQYAFWKGFKKDKVFDALNNHGMGNGFSIYEKNEEYVDFFDFASHREDNEMVNYILNHIDLFLRFIEYFKEKSFLLLDLKDEKNLLFPKKFISFEEIPRGENLESKTSKTLSHYSLNGERIKHSNDALSLSRKELECLKLLSNGKTTKEVSKSLGFSLKAVESYIQMSKMKLNAMSREELLTFYMQKLKRTNPLGT